MVTRPILLALGSVNHSVEPGPCAMALGSAVAGGGASKPVDGPTRTDAPDAMSGVLGEPHSAIGARRDAARVARFALNRELADRAGRRDSSNSFAVSVGEPNVAVGPRRDRVGEPAARPCELADLAADGNAGNSAAGTLRVPQIAFGTGGNRERVFIG